MNIPRTATALLIDADNISANQISLVFAHLQVEGNLLLKRAYGDWFDARLKNWQSILTNHEIEPIHSLPTASGKNATDIRLVVDAMDLLHHRQVNWFCIVSSDRDFTPLIRYLKQAGAQVIGYGRKNALPILQNAYHQFISLEELAPSQFATQPTLQVIEGKATQSARNKQTQKNKQTQHQQTQKNKQTQSQQTQLQASQAATKPYAKELQQMAQTVYIALSANGGWVTCDKLQSGLQKQCPENLNQRFSCKLFGYKGLANLLDGIGIFEFDPQQKASTLLSKRKIRLRKAA
jgi:hypothetical protein